ncbi:PQQ-dependent sugar dehydrogenase [Rhizomonospora bruguierae]|uniref:PQQ-dependent sugar dehydrogenase n=1 Tax=Rhizomonospora bruguierae TaxID=1581705 RepID=UPI0020C08378|nr:PQQ-dependent sugar dehydrogenase [Micromonospora sp. NBRC 107566]
MRRLAASGVALALLGTAACGTGRPGPTPTTLPVTGPTTTAPAPATSAARPAPGPPSVIATGLEVPWEVAFLPDGAALVTERDSGRILRVEAPAGGGQARVSEVRRIRPSVHRGEGGLMGLAVSPGYATDKTIFIYYTTGDDNRIARLTLGGEPQPIVTGIPAAANHNGGRLAFGPDGYLYASTGDAADRARAQEPGNLGGKILRMTPDGRPAPGNPFGTLVWSYGHRNVQGLAWDRAGHLYATEFGQNTWDEINLIERGGNYGWPAVEGRAGNPRYMDPVAQWHTGEASCSGAAVVGDVLVAACLRGERLWAMDLKPGGGLAGQPRALLHGDYGRLRAAVVAPDGALWVTTSNRDGRGSPSAADDRIIRVTDVG